MNRIKPNPDLIEWQVSSNGEGISPTAIAMLEQATQNEQMIPLNEEVVKGHRYNVVAWHMGRLAGYAAIGASYRMQDRNDRWHEAVELGGAVVLPDFRGQGLAGRMLEKRIEILEAGSEFQSGTRAVVFTNEKSHGYVRKRDFAPLDSGERLSKEAFELCGECTHCPTGIKPIEDPTVCCDYNGILVKEIVK